MWQLWLIAAGIFFVAEIFTSGFLIFWLGIAALLTMIVSFFTSNILIQTSIFVFSSGLLILLTKPLVNKIGIKETVPTNVFSMIGKRALVIQDINYIKGTGQIKINGEIWSAEGINEMDIPKDSEVVIIEIKGVKAIVEPIKRPYKNSY